MALVSFLGAGGRLAPGIGAEMGGRTPRVRWRGNTWASIWCRISGRRAEAGGLMMTGGGPGALRLGLKVAAGSGECTTIDRIELSEIVDSHK